MEAVHPHVITSVKRLRISTLCTASFIVSLITDEQNDKQIVIILFYHNSVKMLGNNLMTISMPTINTHGFRNICVSRG